MSGYPGDLVADVLHAWADRPHRGVIFDFNGTLSDDEALLQEIFTEIFAESLSWSLTPQEYDARLAGRSDREIVELVVAEQGGGAAIVEEILAARGARYQELVRTRSPVLPATADLVQRLADAGVPLALVTGARRAEVELVLEHSAVGSHFGRLVTEEDVRFGKPHPEGFLRGADLLGLAPEHILVLEDSVPGVEGARAAGMWCVAVEGRRDSPGLTAATPVRVRTLRPELLNGLPGF